MSIYLVPAMENGGAEPPIPESVWRTFDGAEPWSTNDGSSYWEEFEE